MELWLKRTTVACGHRAKVGATIEIRRCLGDMTGLTTLPLAILSCTLLLTGSLARAQPAPADQAALELLRLRIRAQEHEKRAQYAACAATYLEIYHKAPKADRADEVLYNAGVCFEVGAQIARAIETFDLLIKRFPRAQTSMKALVRIGSASASIADFDRAARAYEHYAKRYPGEKDAPQALANATTYRMALGHNKEVVANVERFTKNYKKKRKLESASAQFALAGHYESEANTEKMVQAYQRYIKDSGRAGGADRLLIAHAKLGVAQWGQSCKRAADDHSCVRLPADKGPSTKPKVATHCGPKPPLPVQVLPRLPRLAKEAKQHFEKTLSLARRAVNKAPDASRKAAVQYWVAAARFYLHQEDFEALLSLKFPRGLDFVPGTKKSERSEQRFSAWLKEMSSKSQALRASYVELVGPEVGLWTLAAHARVGQMAGHFAKLLQTAEIPNSVRTGPHANDGVAAFCDAMTAAAVPLEEQAIAAYASCLERSKTLDHFDTWSRLCEKELALLRPEDFPASTEIHNPATAVGDLLSLAPLLVEPIPEAVETQTDSSAPPP